MELRQIAAKVGIEKHPENTSLERKLKRIYLDGGCTHVYAGILK